MELILYCYFVDPPIWKGSQLPVNHVTADEGNDVILTCDVCSHPPASYIWIRNGEIIEGETNEQFQIEKITIAALGNYTCVAENNIQNKAYKKEFAFDLTLKGPPHKPTNFKVTSRTSVGVCLSWIPGFDGGSEMTLNLTHQIVTSSGSPVTSTLDGKTTSYCLTSLRSNTTYQVELTANNRYNGASKSLPAVFEVGTRGMEIHHNQSYL